jgi:hypothetical protein
LTARDLLRAASDALLMPPRLTDPEVQALAGISATLAAEYRQEGEDPWEGSPFEWIRTQSSRRRGKIGEQLLSGYLAARDFTVGPAKTSQADRRVNGKLVEVKFSTLWESGIYKFQQIRDQKYDLMVLLGVCPFDAHCWVITKETLREHVIGAHGMGQHGGGGASETSWVSFPPAEPPAWLRRHGGNLRLAVERLRALAPDD